MAERRAAKRQRAAVDADRERELEAQLFGRDEEALQQLGTELGGGGGGGGDGSLSDFLASYQQGAAAAAAADGSDDDDEERQQHGSAGGLVMFEDRGGADAQPAAAARRRRQAVWEDPQDAALRVNVAAKSQLRKLRREEEETELTGREYESRLRQQHNKLHPRTAWASLKKAGERRRRAAAGGASDSEEEGGESAAERLLQRAGGLLARGSALPPSMLETTRLRDANQADACKGAVKSVEFHAGGELLLSAGLDRRLRLFSVDGVKNPRVHSWFIEDMPIHKAAFTAGGSKIVATGRRKFFYLVDVESQAIDRLASLRVWRDEKSFESFVTSQQSPQPMAAFFGNEGFVPLVSLHTKQMVGSLKMNGTARTGAFTTDGTQLLTSGGDGTVYVWDLRTQRCLQRYQDEGCLNGTSMACSPDGALFATGSNSGVVNLYSRQQQEAQRRQGQRTVFGEEEAGSWAMPEAPYAGKPLKSVLNLTTTIDSLAFNHDGQMLVMASRMKRDALRVLHVPSMTIFSNWPTSKSPLHYVHSTAYSPNSGYLAIGNARGRVLLYRLHHYNKA
ncbi:hypothetical protein COHA_007020 [Chlorella ohadii]|uniref:U3 small nucleolar RNA-associated protein 18 homolog n=1 Tax=Chlorella ohadii TaxID=2649997 RepID=A0AAD5DJK9_9CHLO|nr:hypothetical protein COHA_007020 [Chlorella ohadii]